MRIRVKKLSDTARLPHRGSKEAAGYDLYADLKEPVTIAPHTNELISTGLAIEVPEGYFGGIFARSGLAVKENLRPANCTGVVDSDYRGLVHVALHNDSDRARVVAPGERVAQLIIMPYLTVEFEEVPELSDTIRGEGGFGSTGLE